MSHVLSWDVKENGALVVLKGAPLVVLVAYDIYADDFGNSWASTSSDKDNPGALNRATGLSHQACIDARKMLIAHHCIEQLPRETIASIYSKRRSGLRPPANADVYHVTCVIRTCADPECTCLKSLQVKGVDLSIFHTCLKSRHDLDSTTGKTLEDNTSSCDRPNIYTVYEHEIGMLTPIVQADIDYWATIVPEAWIEEALTLSALNNARKWSYALSIIKRWKSQGKDSGKKPSGLRKPNVDAQPSDTRALDAVRAKLKEQQS